MKHFKTFRQFRQHIVCIFAAFAFAVAGCGGADDGIYLEQAGSTQMDSMVDSGDGGASGAGENASSGAGAEDSDSGTGAGDSGSGDNAGSKGSASGTGSAGSGETENSGSGTGASDDTGTDDDAGSKSDADAGESSGQDGDSLLFVYVCGAVARPGVYELPAGGRVFEAVELAGGMTEDAGLSGVNQAEQVSDGQMIYIPTQQEIDDGTSGQAPAVQAQGAAQGEEAEAGEGAPGGDGLIDLNTATQEQLMTLSGIGEAKAKSILDYREEHGGFSSPEEVMQVEGIKEGLYNRIKDDIKVS